MSCPSNGELVSVFNGELPPAEAKRVWEHARTCATCQSTISQLAAAAEEEVSDDSDEEPLGGNGKVTGATVPARVDERLTVPEFPDGPPQHRDDTGRGGDEAGALERGATVGRYDILRHLGSGGMGVVYAAYDPQLDRRVALKVLGRRDRFGISSERLQLRLQREAQAMARLTHPNVVAVHDVAPSRVGSSWP